MLPYQVFLVWKVLRPRPDPRQSLASSHGRSKFKDVTRRVNFANQWYGTTFDPCLQSGYRQQE